MPATNVILSAIAAEPGDDTAWLALADCLEEQGQPDRAELVRLREWLRHAPLDHPERRQRETRLQALLASGVLPVGPRLQVPLTKRKTLDLALIPPGSFLMGDPLTKGRRSGGEPRQMTVALPFYLGIYPITQSQWIAVMGKNPSHFKKADRPVERLTWKTSLEFCEKLSEHTKRKFRLPTEVEWEYACRAGTTSSYSGGDTLDDLRRIAWCSYERGMGTALHSVPVGQFIPNAWGLYDMHGNILESCYDAGKPWTAADARTVRGGSWGNTPDQCRSGWRFKSRDTACTAWLGIRVLLPTD